LPGWRTSGFTRCGRFLEMTRRQARPRHSNSRSHPTDDGVVAPHFAALVWPGGCLCVCRSSVEGLQLEHVTQSPIHGTFGAWSDVAKTAPDEGPVQGGDLVESDPRGGPQSGDRELRVVRRERVLRRGDSGSRPARAEREAHVIAEGPADDERRPELLVREVRERE